VNATVDCADPVTTGASVRWLRMSAWVVVLGIAVGLFVSTLEHTLAAVVDNLVYFVVNRSQIVAATRDDSGRVVVTLRDSDRPIGVSRAFAHHFRAM